MVNFLSGAFAMGAFTAAMFFLRAWSRTSDRLFLIFGVGFGLLCFERFVLIAANPESEFHPLVYLVRLTAFLTIIFGVVDKNLKRS